MSAEATLAALSPRSKHIDGAGFGGVPKLTVSDIAASLAGLSVIQTLIMRAKWIGDGHARIQLEREVAGSILQAAQARKLREITWKRCHGAARIVMSHCIDPVACTDCRGTGYLPTSQLNPKVFACKTCGGEGERGGDGRFRMKESEESFMSGIPLSTYRGGWKEICQSLIDDLSIEESDAIASIRKRLWGE